jgi:hypothetical protein
MPLHSGRHVTQFVVVFAPLADAIVRPPEIHQTRYADLRTYLVSCS